MENLDLRYNNLNLIFNRKKKYDRKFAYRAGFGNQYRHLALRGTYCKKGQGNFIATPGCIFMSKAKGQKQQ